MEVKRLHSGFCTILDEVGTDFQMHGVSFFGYFFCSSKKVTEMLAKNQKEVKEKATKLPTLPTAPPEGLEVGGFCRGPQTRPKGSHPRPLLAPQAGGGMGHPKKATLRAVPKGHRKTRPLGSLG
jgi:hypothetical protein